MNKLITIATPEIAAHAKPFLDNQREYAARHSYIFECIESKAWPHLHASFSKVAEIDRCLREGCEWIIWADADVAFTNFTRDIKDILVSRLPERPDLWLAGKEQRNWLTWKYICNGLLVIRNTPDAHAYMEKWIDRCLHGDPNLIPGKRTMILDHPWEQWHFDALIRETQYHGAYAALSAEIGGFCPEIWTDNDDWQPGHLSMHFAGPATFERRAQLFQDKYQPLIVR